MRVVEAIATFLITVLFVAACGAAASDASTPNAGGAAGNPAAGGALGGGGGAGNTSGGANNGAGGALALDAAADAPGLTADAACAAETFVGEPAPLNLMVMLDRSCSMSAP